MNKFINIKKALESFGIKEEQESEITIYAKISKWWWTCKCKWLQI
jgi:hypothetical protein